MASTLMQIKAQMLLPSRKGKNPRSDPREELINKLLDINAIKKPPRC